MLIIIIFRNNMCVYCNKLYKNNLDYLKNIGYKYSNRILFKNKYFFIVPTVGSFIENYLLIIPNRHVCSMRGFLGCTKTY